MLPGMPHPPPATMVVRTLHSVATAYCPDGYESNHTFTGTRPRPGVIAVNPKFIPFGSYLLIGGQVYHAEDQTNIYWTPRNVVDIWADKCADAWKWGRRNVTIRILGNPKPVHRRATLGVRRDDSKSNDAMALALILSVIIGIWWPTIRHAFGGRA